MEETNLSAEETNLSVEETNHFDGINFDLTCSIDGIFTIISSFLIEDNYLFNKHFPHMYMPDIYKAISFAKIKGGKIIRKAFHWLISLSLQIQMCKKLHKSCLSSVAPCTDCPALFQRYSFHLTNVTIN